MRLATGSNLRGVTSLLGLSVALFLSAERLLSHKEKRKEFHISPTSPKAEHSVNNLNDNITLHLAMYTFIEPLSFLYAGVGYLFLFRCILFFFFWKCHWNIYPLLRDSFMKYDDKLAHASAGFEPILSVLISQRFSLSNRR